MGGTVAIVDDLFFVGMLQGTARQAGVPLRSLTAANTQLDLLRQEKPALIIIDLNCTSADPVELVRRLKADPELRRLPVLGFFSHVLVELQRAAQAAGCDQVLPRSKFTATLPELLRRYGGAEARPADAGQVAPGS